MTIIDARNVAPGSTLSTEICVIGAGPVGIAAALTASRLGRQVLLLESGDLTTEEPANEALNATDSVGYQPQGLFGGAIKVQDFSQRQLGGASNHFAGFCHPWEDDDYVGCPVTKAEMDPWYVHAHNFWGQGPVNYDPAYWAGVTGKPLPPSLGPELVFKIVQQRGQKFGDVNMTEITNSTTLQLVHHANVTNLNAASGGGHVNTATVQTLTGVTFTVQATAFVVATGGHQTPRLLLMSNNVVPAGLGNEHDQVGRYYADHLASGIAFIYLTKSLTELGLMTGMQNVATTSPNGTPTTTNILPVLDMSAAAIAAKGYALHCEVTAYDLSGQADMVSPVGPTQIKEFMSAQGAAAQSQLIFRTFLKQTSNPGSQVRLSTTKTDAFGRPCAELNWQPPAVDAANRKAAMRFYQEQLHLGGLGVLHNTLNCVAPTHIDQTKPVPTWLQIFPPAGDEPDPPHESCFHAMCTTRMSTDPTQGVVDSDCKVHTVDNLYIAGPSVFHKGAGYYPTMPAVAFAARLGSHLNGVLP